MHFFLRQTTITILAITLWNNILASGCLTSANHADKPATTLSNNSPYPQETVPSGWRKIDADGRFSFYLPPRMRDTGISGTESLHREYTNGRMHLSFDYQPQSFLAYAQRARSFGKGFQEIELQVDGRKSFLFLHQSSDRRKQPTYNADLYVGDLPNGQVTLHMWMSSKSALDVEAAKTIFQAIKFSSS